MNDFRKLMFWQKSHDLALDTYRVTEQYPASELYGLTSQLRRAVSSIPTNIAEGCGRDSKVELARFVEIASGSAFEVDYLFQLAHELGYMSDEDHKGFSEKIIEIKKMLFAYSKKVRINAKKI
ncbi:MAG: four helix bundle protein [Planctomycetes bacterium]|nr:four helix bundle protein [Planctomycetota bacterium]